jgi:hypothetical protein
LRRFSNDAAGAAALCRWLGEIGAQALVMEAIGSYERPLWETAEVSGLC